ncbi:MAG: type I-E CRISPR-associated protein Cse2/CasB [Luteolibacter sp.]
MNPYDESNSRFIAQLTKLCDDRGHSAVLRRYWSETTRHQALPVLGRLGAIGDDRTSTIAALYAVHPNHVEGSGIGRAALWLGDRKDGDHPYDRHFRRLLACTDLDDLAPQLHRLVKRLSREGIPLDYAKLLKELRFWSTGHAENVKTFWAKEFWQAPADLPTP